MSQAKADTTRGSAPPTVELVSRSLGAQVFFRLARQPVSMFGMAGVLLLVSIALLGPLVAPYDPAALSPERLRPPSTAHLMGTENFGRDVFSRFLFGTRVSMFVGLGAVALGLTAGTLLGMTAGLRAGRVWDTLIMRGMDVVLAFPLLVLVPVLAGILQTKTIQIGPLGLNSIALVGLAIGVVSTPVFARVARASVLAEVREDYIMAARSFGAGTGDLLFGNLWPNIQAPLIVQAAFSLAIAIAAEAAVSFLGLGVQPPDSSWGNMLADARRFVISGAWWLVVCPAAGIALAVLSFNLLGDALRDALDPRVERR
ncbi:MAG TPA: ABC transporter permease [Chloroflexota bacterium]|nr:ABC transporter permease [Chloroflexota bacterium]